MKNISILVAVILFMFYHDAFSQIEPARVQHYITSGKFNSNNEITEFYYNMNYKTAWIQASNTKELSQLLNLLHEAAAVGLDEKDYQFDFIDAFRKKTYKLHSIDDSLEAECKLTDVAIHFYQDIAFGNTSPPFGYDGLKFVPKCQNIPALLAKSIFTQGLHGLLQQLSGNLTEINFIQNKLTSLYQVTKSVNFNEVTITSNKINQSNKALVTKLYQLGLLESVNNFIPDSILKKKVREIQTQFGLPADGLLHTSDLHELNISLKSRIHQLSLSLNYFRWLSCLIQKQPVIVVNIPAAYMKVYTHKQVMLEMRLIVGKKMTPTPTLTSMVDEIVLYPYWHVPNSIATKELLPQIKKNTTFLQKGNYQVLDMAGKIIDPNSINWHSLNQFNFPYLIRQSTGCDNALGLLKLHFNNPYHVYLHDTNGKKLFSNYRRYLSHGCMRMEKPMELGHLILKNNTIAIDTLEQKGCLRNQSPVRVPVQEKIAVVVWYNPVGVDSTNRVLFFSDVYNKFSDIQQQGK